MNVTLINPINILLTRFDAISYSTNKFGYVNDNNKENTIDNISSSKM
jgi:hypothetical protein